MHLSKFLQVFQIMAVLSFYIWIKVSRMYCTRESKDHKPNKKHKSQGNASGIGYADRTVSSGTTRTHQCALNTLKIFKHLNKITHKTVKNYSAILQGNQHFSHFIETSAFVGLFLTSQMTCRFFVSLLSSHESGFGVDPCPSQY